MCKTETLGMSPENSQRENREGKKDTISLYVHLPPIQMRERDIFTPSTLLESQSCILDCDYS